MITLYSSTETNFNNNGLGILNDCISAEVTKELNGKYELILYYPLFDPKGMYLNIVAERIIKCPTPDGMQLFRIQKTEKTLTQLYVSCKHISYDLEHCFATNINIDNMTRIGAITSLLANVVSPNNKFSVTGQTTDVLKSTTIKSKNGLDAIIKSEATTILDTWGGEYDFDNYSIIARDQIGSDKGVRIEYRKNLTGITETLDLTDLATRIIPKGKDDLMLPEVYIDSQYINNYSQPYTVELDCSDAATVEELRTAVAQEFAKGVDVPYYNYKVNFVSLAKTAEYKDYQVLETINIGDTVHIKHSDLNIDLSARVILYTYDSILEKYKSIELGKYAKTFSSTLKSILSANKANADTIVKTNINLLAEIAHATALITGNEGGYVLLDPKDKPSRILIMDTDDKNTAQNVWQWNKSGFGHSSTGINGPYDTAITADGHIDARFLTGETVEGLNIIGAIITGGIFNNNNGTFSVDALGNCIANSFNSSNANITGGSIHIDTSGLTDGRIKLTYAGVSSEQSAMGIEVIYANSRSIYQAEGPATFYNGVNTFNVTGQDGRMYSQSAYVVGDISASHYNDHTPFYDGNALFEIANISASENGEIDHNTLPECAHTKIRRKNEEYETLIKEKREVKVSNVKASLKPAKIKGIKFTNISPIIEEDGRSLGDMISVLTKGIQQLIDKNNKQDEIMEEQSKLIKELQK